MKKVIKVLVIILLSLLVIAGIGYVGFNLYFNSLMKDVVTGEKIEVEDASIDKEVEEALKERKVVNFALFGCDSSKGDNSYSSERSDAIKIVSLDYDNKTIKISNLERDVVVYAPGDYQGYLHFNWAYWYGGPTLAVQTINHNLDMDITKYVTITFGVLEDIVDAVGGIDISLTATEAAAFNGLIHTNSVMSIHAVEGVNHLDGYNAMRYTRLRYSDSDFVRVERQNNVIKAVISKLKNEDIKTIMNVVNKVLPNISTNLETNEIKNYLVDLLTSFDLKNIDTNTEPNGEYNDICTCPSLGGYLVRSYSDMATHLHKFIYGEDVNYKPSETLLQTEKNTYSKYGNFYKN